MCRVLNLASHLLVTRDDDQKVMDLARAVVAGSVVGLLRKQ